MATNSIIINITFSNNNTNDQSTVKSIFTSNMGQNVTTAVLRDKTATSGPSDSIYWSLDASSIPRWSSFASVLLTEGRVLVGGLVLSGIVVSRSSAIYSSSNGWQSTSSMNGYHFSHTLTAFANNTKALVVGSEYLNYRRTTEVFDSATNAWKLTSGNITNGRYYHTAILLGNRQILIAGGINNFNVPIAAAEIYDPESNSFENVNSMNEARFLCTSILLSDRSTVLVTGGVNYRYDLINSAELYIDGSWIRAKNNMTIKRTYHTAVLLNNGNVLITGGGDGSSYSLATAEVYNPTTRTFTAVSPMILPRAVHTLTLLPSGKVLVTGGIDWTTNTYPQMCELYDPLTNTWSDTRILNYGRASHQTVLLNDSVFVFGGRSGAGGIPVSSCEKYFIQL